MNELVIVDAPDPQDLAQIARLLRTYRQWLRRRYKGMNDIVRSLFDPLAWEAELDGLAAKYGAPHGALLLAVGGGVPVGCVAYRGLGDGIAEMKRLFVHPQYQGQGVALAMIERLGALANERGFPVMRLETGPRQTEAQSLYATLGLRRIEPYYECQPWFRENVLFYEGLSEAMSLRAGARLLERAGLAA